MNDNSSQPVSCHPTNFGVLVVDDNRLMRQSLGMLLRDNRLDFWLAGDGDQALEIFKRHQQNISLVMLDVCMEGRDGPSTLAALKAINPNIEFCFMTGGSPRYTESQLTNLGARHVFHKPFPMEDLRRLLRQLVNERHVQLPEPGSESNEQTCA